MHIRTITAALALLGSTAVASAETHVVFNSYLAPRNEIMRTGVIPWAEAIAANSGGSVTIDFTASSLAPPPRQLDMVRAGIADAAINLSSFTSTQWLAPLIAELPMLFTEGSTTAHSVALWRTYERFFREVEQLEGIHVVALWSLTGNHVWNNLRPIETAADAAGLRLRVNPNGTETATALGAVVVSRPAVESYEIISRGVVDGTLLPILSVDGLGLLDELRYGTLFGKGLYRSTVSIVFNEDFWQRMPEEDRAIIEAVSGEALARMAGANLDAGDAATRAQLEPSGIQITEFPEAEMATLRQRLAFVTEEWSARVAALGLDPEQILASYRAELAAADGH